MQTPGDINTLPVEILRMIIKEWSEPHMEFVCGFVCKKWRNEIVLIDNVPRLCWMGNAKSVVNLMDKNASFLAEASKAGHLDILKWAYESGCPAFFTPMANLCATAALGGQMKVLKWARKELGCSLNKSACVGAAHAGSLEVMQWLREEGCPWSEQVLRMAVMQGHLALVQWLIESGCPQPDGSMCETAARNGHHTVVEYLEHPHGATTIDIAKGYAARGEIGRMKARLFLDHDEDSFPGGLCLGAAIRGRQVNVVAWLLDSMSDSSKQEKSSENYGWFKTASRLGPLSLLETLVNGCGGVGRCPIEAASCCARALAATPPQWEIIQWLQRHYTADLKDFWDHFEFARLVGKSMDEGEATVMERIRWMREVVQCEWSSLVFEAAIEDSPFALKVLKYLRKEGCPCCSHAWKLAVTVGNIEMMEWLKRKGCPLNGQGKKLVLKAMSRHDRYSDDRRPVVQWVRTHLDAPWNPNIWTKLIRDIGTDVETLRWLKEEGCPVPENDRASLLEAACGAGLTSLKFVVEELGVPLDESQKLHEVAIQKGYLHVIKWLNKKKVPWGKGSLDQFHLTQLAAEKGERKILLRLVKDGCHFNPRTILAHAVNDVSTLQWLKDRGAILTEDLVMAAAEQGRLPALKWAFENHCTYYGSQLVKAAKKDKTILKWLEENTTVISYHNQKKSRSRRRNRRARAKGN